MGPIERPKMYLLKLTPFNPPRPSEPKDRGSIFVSNHEIALIEPRSVQRHGVEVVESTLTLSNGRKIEVEEAAERIAHAINFGTSLFDKDKAA